MGRSVNDLKSKMAEEKQDYLAQAQQADMAAMGNHETGSRSSNNFSLFIGLGTASVLAYGLYSFTQAQGSLQSNRAMRMRVVAQGVTLGALMGIAGYQRFTEKPREPDAIVEKGHLRH